MSIIRFPINEKYQSFSLFQHSCYIIPLKYEYIDFLRKYIIKNQNPPKIKIKFFYITKILMLINCFSNEENVWRNSKISFKDNNLIAIKLDGKFITERGRINCSLKRGMF